MLMRVLQWELLSSLLEVETIGGWSEEEAETIHCIGRLQGL